ncbi:MAG: HEAT repeat domain-containing protein [Thioalkalispiraceae bacterium]|jgi:serine/threonine-protein kinase
MALLGSFKINKAINLLLMSQQASAADIKEAVAKIKDTGRSAVPKLIEALADDVKNKYINKLLLELLNNQTLPEYIDALADEDKNIVTGTMRILASSSSYDPNLLFDLFKDPDIPNNVLSQILLARREKLDGNNLFFLMNKVDTHSQKAILHVINEVATEKMIPQLCKYANSEDVNIRHQVAKTLSKFDGEQVRDTLLKLLKDSSKAVRQAAAQGLGKVTVNVPSSHLCEALRDPDMNVQSSVIEALTKKRDDRLISNLVHVLQDESEYVRRAAVEVLNEVSDPSSIKELLSAMRDSDWWVKVRAADALGSIGGPRVVDAVIGLLSDEDEFLRRTAVEILNSLKDERAFDHLVKALQDEDWWVRERAADALTKLGDQRATRALLEMMNTHPDSAGVAAKALAELGDQTAVQPLIDALASSNEETRKDLIQSLNQLATPENRSMIQQAINNLSGSHSTMSKPAPSSETEMDTVAVNLGQELSSPSQSNPSQTGSQSASQPAPPASGAFEIIDADSLKPGHVIQDRYEVIKKIGKGAFGVVLLVKDKMVDEEIILKFLNPHMVSDQTIIDRFIHELRFSRKLTHENIIRIYDFITFGRSYAISMEYFKSHSLSAEIKKHKPIDIARNIKIIIDICKGLSIAHAAKVVHRDIKPANILVNDQDVVKIVDFGLAAATMSGDARMTKSGVLVGTPTYMAPEQVRGRAIDTRTDIYSLGIVMYELFTGKAPYKGEDHMATLFMHVEGGAKPPSTINPRISEYLDKVIMKAIHVDPKERYQTVDELRRDLVMALAKEAS